MLDTMWAGAGGPPNPTLLARNAYIDMMQTAQNVADRYELTREEIDAFALRSHQYAAAARDSGRLAAEIHPVEIPATRKAAGADVRARREHPRRHDGGELAALPPQPGTTQMTAGNSSPLNDGASAVVLASARRPPRSSASSHSPEWSRRRRTRSTRRSWESHRRSRSQRRSRAPA